MVDEWYEQFSEDVFGIGSNIDIFITKPLTAEDLKGNWDKMRTQIAMTYQRSLDDDFERWNFYIFYVLKKGEHIDENLKFKIEHDTLSSRKIIISEEKTTGKKQPDDLIAKYLCYSLNLEVANDIGAAFVKNPDVEKLLKKKL